MARWKLRRPPEWGTEPVPRELRVLRTFDLFVLWSSLAAGLLVFAAGTLLVSAFGLTLWESVVVSLVGSVVGSLMLAAAAVHGSRAGVPTMVSLRPILGRRGSYIPTALNVLQLLGWTAFELVVMGEAAAVLTNHALGPLTAQIFVPLWAVVIAVLALGGPLAVIRDWLERFAIWAVYASTIAIAVAVLLHGLDFNARPAAVAGNFSSPASILLGLDVVVAMPISWWPLVSDYNRFARRSRDSVVATTLGYTVANLVFYVLGATLVFLGITSFGLSASDPATFLAAIGLLGLSFLPLLIILVDETDNAFADVYSAAVSYQNLAPRQKQFWPVVVATVMGAAVALLLLGQGEPIGGGYESFLLLVGALFVPLLGTVIADSFLVRRMNYVAEEFSGAAPKWRWPAYASWLPGVVLYFGIIYFQIPVGATLPSFALAVILHLVFSKIDSRITSRPTPSPDGDR